MIKSVKLSDFRNFRSKLLEFSDKITVIIGPNASGKTNILESLYLLSTGKSFKAKLEAEMIKEGQDLSRIVGQILPGERVTGVGEPQVRGPELVSRRNGPGADERQDPREFGVALEAVITKGDNGWPRKKLLINGVPKRMVDFAGNFKVVLFGPWDMDLVTESPSLRRKFLDSVLSQVDREYRRSVLSYEKGLRQRNKVLWRLREDPSTPFGRSGRSMLAFWNQLLIKNGDYITQKREEFISFVNSQSGLNDMKFQLDYDRSVISEGRLEQYSEEEVAAATTLVGPHRDDFIFEIRNSKHEIRNLASFGSRGEQRMGILWLKMAELSYIEEKSGERPTLLLDDIFSELDHEHREIVVNITGKQQTIITTADPHFVKDLKRVEKIEL